ncbi:XIAP-associated factor 1 [Osmerus mordax]|uniref:XIAP-associated factor 1 n=1 Tax=Osmerus mordax TaxID=8014 RepID=UPI003510C9E6
MEVKKNAEEMRVCGQCNKQVAEANFALHESHCQRFLCLCPDCDEPVPREQLDQHRVDQHTQVKCSKCHKKVESGHLMDHKSDECDARLQCCEFCQLEVPWSSLADHSLTCGSRTELCAGCGRYVTLRDQLEHAQICLQADSTPKLTKKDTSVLCRSCMKTFTSEHIDQHQLTCDLYQEEAEVEDHLEIQKDSLSSGLSNSLKSASFFGQGQVDAGGDGEKDQISTCPHCHLALPLVTLKWHKAKCQIYASLK